MSNKAFAYNQTNFDANNYVSFNNFFLKNKDLIYMYRQCKFFTQVTNKKIDTP